MSARLIHEAVKKKRADKNALLVESFEKRRVETEAASKWKPPNDPPISQAREATRLFVLQECRKAHNVALTLVKTFGYSSSPYRGLHIRLLIFSSLIFILPLLVERFARHAAFNIKKGALKRLGNHTIILRRNTTKTTHP